MPATFNTVTKPAGLVFAVSPNGTEVTIDWARANCSCFLDALIALNRCCDYIDKGFHVPMYSRHAAFIRDLYPQLS
jgi:hypothetical protein